MRLILWFAAVAVSALLVVDALCAQTGPATARFEVVSIKEAPPLTAAEMASPGSHGLRVIPGRLEARWVQLSFLIPMAYQVPFQYIDGPRWLIKPEVFETQMFDIQAKLPEGSTKGQIPEMLRSMLEERFKLTVHRETRQELAMALVVGDKGPKLTETIGAGTLDPPAKVAPIADYQSGGGEQIQYFRMPNNRSMTITTRADSTEKVTTQRDRPGTLRHYEVTGLTMKRLAELLHTELPVVDMTGLTGRYTVTLDLPAWDMNLTDGPPAAAAALAKLGLKLVKRKAPVEYLVVDHVEKYPTAN
jgi:uncharacterized protein (TIGR03435 family)